MVTILSYLELSLVSFYRCAVFIHKSEHRHRKMWQMLTRPKEREMDRHWMKMKWAVLNVNFGACERVLIREEIRSLYELCRLQSGVQSFSWPCFFFIHLPLIYISQQFAMCSSQRTTSRNPSTWDKTARMHLYQRYPDTTHRIVSLISQLCIHTALLHTAVSETFLHKPLSHNDML